jgi:hypothetical protein
VVSQPVGDQRAVVLFSPINKQNLWRLLCFHLLTFVCLFLSIPLNNTMRYIWRSPRKLILLEAKWQNLDVIQRLQLPQHSHLPTAVPQLGSPDVGTTQRRKT